MPAGPPPAMQHRVSMVAGIRVKSQTNIAFRCLASRDLLQTDERIRPASRESPPYMTAGYLGPVLTALYTEVLPCYADFL